MRRIFLIAALPVLLLACADKAQKKAVPVPITGDHEWPSPQIDPDLQAQFEQLVRDFEGRVGIYVRHLPTGRSAAINADELFPTASLIKIPFLFTVFQHIENDKLEYHQVLTFRDSLRYHAPEDILVWFKDGAEIGLSQVVMLMLTVSDNTAAIWLETLVGGGVAVNEWLAVHGFEKTRVNSGVPGREEAYERYGWGQTTPREMTEMFVRIYRGEAVSPAASLEMYRALTDTYWDGRALSQIPATVQAISKQGWVSHSRSEVVLVNAPHGSYVFCVITANQEDTSFTHDNAGYELIRNVSRLLWNYFEPQSNWAPPEGMKPYY